jgi:hypothetical protein
MDRRGEQARTPDQNKGEWRAYREGEESAVAGESVAAGIKIGEGRGGQFRGRRAWATAPPAAAYPIKIGPLPDRPLSDEGSSSASLLD